MAKENKVAKTFKISDNIHARIKLLAAMRETTLSEQVERALLSYLNDNNAPDMDEPDRGVAR